MDATGVVVSDGSEPQARHYGGAFYSVAAFLRVLYGDKIMVVRDQSNENLSQELGREVEAWIDRWGTWKVGFSHFIQLSEIPNDAVLWAMLARRAAGIFPCDYKGVDLLIPIFNGTSVSLILVQVTNRADNFSFPDSATNTMRPLLMLAKELKEQRAMDVVRMSMNLRGPQKTTREQFFLLDPGVRHSKQVAAGEGLPGEDDTAEVSIAEDSGAETAKSTVLNPDFANFSGRTYTLCLTGLQAWSAKSVKNSSPVPVMSSDVAVELRGLLEPWWETCSLVDDDLARRQELDLDVMDNDVARDITSRPLVRSVLKKW